MWEDEKLLLHMGQNLEADPLPSLFLQREELEENTMSHTLYFFMGFLVGIVAGFVIWVWMIAKIGRDITKNLEKDRERKT